MEMLTYREAARLLGVSVSTVYGWAYRRQIPHIRLSVTGRPRPE